MLQGMLESIQYKIYVLTLHNAAVKENIVVWTVSYGVRFIASPVASFREDADTGKMVTRFAYAPSCYMNKYKLWHSNSSVLYGFNDTAS